MLPGRRERCEPFFVMGTLLQDDGRGGGYANRDGPNESAESAHKTTRRAVCHSGQSQILYVVTPVNLRYSACVLNSLLTQ
jgi:hypothetical protein